MTKQGPFSGHSFTSKDATGRKTPLRLTSLIAECGEGAVYRTDWSGQVAKIYKNPVRDRFRKLGIMLARPPRDPAAPGISIAWPTAIVEDGNARGAGFLMPEISAAKRPTFLYVPKTRKKDAAGVDWFLLHVAALNVTKVFKAVHELGYVIGDVRPENLLVDAQMRVFAIDTDSFQISDPHTKLSYRCTVGTLEYTPPELMGKEFGKIDRKIEHDNFGLAIIIYLFLFGRHPFSGGILTGDLEGLETGERIRRGLWQWNKQRSLRPHAGSLPFDIVHPGLQHLFRRCFDRGHQAPGQRPTAGEWGNALEKAVDDLVWCNSEPLHVYSSHSKSCPWCDLARSGIDMFPTRPGITSSSYAALVARFQSCVVKGDIVVADAMLRRHPRLQNDRAIAEQRAHVDKHKAELDALRQLKSDLGHVNERELIKRLQANAALRSLALADESSRPQIEHLLKLAPALEELDKAIGNSKPADGSYKFADEKQIMELASKHRDVLIRSPGVAPYYNNRLTAAHQRVKAFMALQQAEAAASPDKVLAVLREHEKPLNEIADFCGRREHFDQLRRQHEQLANFIQAATGAIVDPISLCQIWESQPDLADLEVAKIPQAVLNGQSPLAVYQRLAAARDAFLALADQVTAIDGTDSRINEATEKAIVNFAADTERNHGPVPPLQDGHLHQRVEAARKAIGHFTKLRRLAKRWPSGGRQLVSYWRSIGARGSYDLDPSLSSLIGQAEAAFDHVDGFVKIAAGGPEPDEQALVAYADAHPDLADHDMARGVLIAGKSIRERVDLARSRVAGAAEVERAIFAADVAPVKTEAGERGIVDAWQRHAAHLHPWPVARRRFDNRVQAATERIRRADELAKALEAGNRAGIVSTWGSDNLLRDYAPALQHHTAIDYALRLSQRIAELAAQLSQNAYDDAAIVRIAEPGGREFGAEAREPQAELMGKSLHDWAELARRRSAFVAKLTRPGDVSPDELLAIAADWEPAFDATHPAIARFRSRLQRAKELSANWSTLIGALQRGEDRRVIELWSETDFRTLREAERWTTDLRSCIERYVQSVDAFSPPALASVTIWPDGRILLKWQWNDPRISHAIIVMGDRSAPANERENLIERTVVSKVEFDATAGALIAFKGRLLTAVVCPAIQFRGEIIWNAAKRIVLHENGRRSLRYRVRVKRGWVGKQELELTLDRSVPLPRMKVITEEGPRKSIVLAPPFAGANGRYVIPLPGDVRPWSRKKAVKLQLDQSEDARWLEIIHPDRIERTMVV